MGLRLAKTAPAEPAYAAENSASRHEKMGLASTLLLPVDLDANRPAGALVSRLTQLRLEFAGLERFAAQAPAADGAAAERKIDARIAKLGQDLLFDVVKRQRSAGETMRQAFERPGNLPDAVGRIVRRAPSNRVAIDNRAQHERRCRRSARTPAFRRAAALSIFAAASWLMYPSSFARSDLSAR